MERSPAVSVNQEPQTRENIATNEVYVEKLEKNIANTIENAAKIIPEEELFRS